MLSTANVPERLEPGAGSQASFAYEAIRADILRGRHMPNAKLKVHELAHKLRVSPGAVREALFRLVSEKLVEARDGRGFAVTPVSLADLQELTDLRCEIEAIACRRSVERGGIEWESGLVAAQYRLRATSESYAENDEEVSQEFLAAHAALHEALTAAAGNSRLLALRAELFDQYQRFRAFYAQFAGKRHLAGEHDRLVQLALSRDADGLVAAMTAHLTEIPRRIAQALERT